MSVASSRAVAAAALFIALGGAWLSTSGTPGPEPVWVSGADSERAARALAKQFGVRPEPPVRPPDHVVIPVVLGVVAGASATMGMTGSARVALSSGGTAAVGALGGAGVVQLLGLGGSPGLAPGPVAAMFAGIISLVIRRRAGAVRRTPIMALWLAALFIPPIPALRSLALAGLIGSGAGWAAAATVRLSGAAAGARWDWLAWAGAIAAAAIASSVGNTPSGPTPVTAPAGLHIVVTDPRGFRGQSFSSVYELAHSLLDYPAIGEVRSIATLVSDASQRQAQNFWLSPLGAEPSEGLVSADGDTTRMVVRPTPRIGSAGAEALVGRIREQAASVLPDGADALVGGAAAARVDLRRAELLGYGALAAAAMITGILLWAGYGIFRAGVAVGPALVAAAAVAGIGTAIDGDSVAALFAAAAAGAVVSALLAADDGAVARAGLGSSAAYLAPWFAVAPAVAAALMSGTALVAALESLRRSQIAGDSPIRPRPGLRRKV